MPRLSTIRRPRTAVACAAAVAAAAIAAATPVGLAQAPASGSQTRTASGSVLAGQVIDADTGAPIAHTVLGLSRRRGPGPNTTPSDTSVPLVLLMADDRGRFVVRDIPAGSYLLLATAPGYIISNHGQARPAGPTRTIDLDGLERRTGLTIPLWRHAVITGAVTDERGEPVVGATVRVLRRIDDSAGGERRFLPGSLTTTDDRGIYRLTALTPGQFMVGVLQTQVTIPTAVVDAFVQSASPDAASDGGSRLLELMNSASAAPSAGGGIRVDDLLLQSAGSARSLAVPPPAGGGVATYPTAFYGASADDPALIAVDAGEERGGVDIRLTPERAVRIAGVVRTDAGPAGGVVVRLARTGGARLQNENGYEAATTVSAADGSFTLLGITSGTYTLKALRFTRPQLPPALQSNPAIVAAYGGEGPRAPETAGVVGAQVSLRVGDADVRDVDVHLRSGAAVSGRVVFDGGTPSDVDRQRMGVLLTAEGGGLPGAGLFVTRLTEDNRFEIRAPAPGRYLVTGVALPRQWRLAGATIGGRPLVAPFDLDGPDVADVVLTYTDQLGSVGGTIQRATGDDDIGVEIVVFPVDRRDWRREPLNLRAPAIEQTVAPARYEVDRLLPGEYFVAAVASADVPQMPDAAFFAAVARFAARVTVPAGGMVARALTIGRVR